MEILFTETNIILAITNRVNGTFFLKTIIQFIFFNFCNNSSYRFVAVITFIQRPEGSLAHYVSYCRRVCGFWKCHDHLADRKILKKRL